MVMVIVVVIVIAIMIIVIVIVFVIVNDIEIRIRIVCDCYCIVIPKDELLKRTKYNWFVRLNKNQIINSDNNISNFLMYSLQK